MQTHFAYSGSAERVYFSDENKSVLCELRNPARKALHRNDAGQSTEKSVYRYSEGNMTTRDVESLLTISMYRGEYTGNLTSLVHICDIQGGVVPEGRQPFSLFAEALKVLEICAGGTLHPSGEYVTVFIGRKTHSGVKPQARIAVATRNGRSGACFRLETSTRVDTEVVEHGDDDVVTIVRKVLDVFVRRNRFNDTLDPQSRWSRGHA